MRSTWDNYSNSKKHQPLSSAWNSWGLPVAGHKGHGLPRCGPSGKGTLESSDVQDSCISLVHTCFWTCFPDKILQNNIFKGKDFQVLVTGPFISNNIKNSEILVQENNTESSLTQTWLLKWMTRVSASVCLGKTVNCLEQVRKWTFQGQGWSFKSQFASGAQGFPSVMTSLDTFYFLLQLFSCCFPSHPCHQTLSDSASLWQDAKPSKGLKNC